jgi:tetratricopeptide (TPR) repeat protein
MLLLAVGAAAEADAFFRHMAIHGSRQWGHSANMAAAASMLSVAEPGIAVDSAMLELRYPELRYHLAGRPGAGAEAWVLLPPEYRLLASAQGQVTLLRSGANDEPVLLVRARGAAAKRFDRLEAGLRRALPTPGDKPRALALVRQALADGPHDDWSRWLLLDQDLRYTVDLGRTWEGPGRAAWQLGPPRTPAPWVELGRSLEAADPAQALRCFDQALSLDPLYAPAFVRKLEALVRQGSTQQADEQRRYNQDAQAAGAWTVAE